MLLAIDMGNTQTALGLFDGLDLAQAWRMPTDRSFTADELHVRLLGYLRMYGMHLEECVDAVAFAGVVPQLSQAWRQVAERLGVEATVVGPATADVTKVHAPNPREVGADRIANAVAAETFYGAPAIVVDFGTATNIDVVDPEGYYIGGAIAPGLRISMDALTARAAQLASVPLETPQHASAAPLLRRCKAVLCWEPRHGGGPCGAHQGRTRAARCLRHRHGGLGYHGCLWHPGL